MGKPFGSRFRQMVRKMQDWWISCWNHAYHLNKSCLPFTTKRLRNFHEFPWGTFCSEMYLLVGYRLEFPKKKQFVFFRDRRIHGSTVKPLLFLNCTDFKRFLWEVFGRFWNFGSLSRNESLTTLSAFKKQTFTPSSGTELWPRIGF